MCNLKPDEDLQWDRTEPGIRTGISGIGDQIECGLEWYLCQRFNPAPSYQ